MQFLANPCFLWRSPNISHKRAVVTLAFAGHLSYDQKQGYRTAQLSLPFQIIQGLSGDNGQTDALDPMMVRDTGIEPVTPTMSM